MPVSWEGDPASSLRIELQADAWDRTRLLEDLSGTFAETRCTVGHPMVKNSFVGAVGNTQALKRFIRWLGNIESVFGTCRVTPRGERPSLWHGQEI